MVSNGHQTPGRRSSRQTLHFVLGVGLADRTKCRSRHPKWQGRDLYDLHGRRRDECFKGEESGGSSSASTKPEQHGNTILGIFLSQSFRCCPSFEPSSRIFCSSEQCSRGVSACFRSSISQCSRRCCNSTTKSGRHRSKSSSSRLLYACKCAIRSRIC